MEGKERVKGNGILLRRPLLVFFGRIMEQQARNRPLLLVVRPANGKGVWWGWARKARRNLANTWPQTFSCILVQGWGIVGEWGGGNRSFAKSWNSIQAKLHRTSSRCTFYSRKQKLLLEYWILWKNNVAPVTQLMCLMNKIFYFLKVHLNFSKIWT